jgi:hypothetical protein
MNARIRQLITGMALPAILLAILLGSAACGKVSTTGRSPSFLVIDSLTATTGAKPGTFSGFLDSDVVTLVKQSINGKDVLVPTIFDDPGKVTLRTLLKDAGNPGAETTPSNVNAVTINRYHVVFVRTDGHNIQGVDVPYAFDGAVTATITPGPVDVGFELVRHQAKVETPLVQLANGGGLDFISTIAEVTFYGQDQAGNDVSVTGNISVNFADFGDPS